MPSKLTITVIVAAVALTAGNAFFHYSRRAAASTLADQPAALVAGTRWPDVKLALLSGASGPQMTGPLPTGCRIMVAFSVTCPHCHSAAQQESAVPDSVRLPVVWISETDDARAREFASMLSPTSTIRFGGPKVFKALKLRAVPAAFLVTPGNKVRSITGYAGSETDHRILRSWCRT